MSHTVKFNRAEPHVEDFSRSQGPVQNRWYRRVKPSAAPMRLFCFPYAGGSARLYRDWHEWCEPEVEVVAIELPGRGFHSRSPAIERMGELMDRLLPVLDPLLDQPFALFGHSMGALIAFELARVLRERGRRVPLHLFVSGMHPPQLPGKCQLHAMPDHELIAALRVLNGNSENLIGDGSLLQLFLPLLRADLRIVETYDFAPALPLQHPITVFSGLDDVATPLERQKEWGQHTTGGFTMRLVEGDHFFILQQAHLLAASILKSLGRTSYPAEFQSFSEDRIEHASEEPENVFTGVK